MPLMFRTWIGLLALPAMVMAQTVTIPTGAATVEGNASNAYPWGRGNGGLLIQTVYDSTHFTQQSLQNPILITGLRWRLDATQARTFAGGSYANAIVRLSTCPSDQALVSTTFAINRGTDLQTVFNGAITLLAGSSTPPGPGPTLVSLSLATPFYYRPASGDLNVEIELPAAGFTGATTHADVKTSNPLASRVYSTTLGAVTGTVDNNHGLVLQLGYTPVTGLRASFLADFTGGVSPLAVQFTDQSFTSATGGITSYAWDFENDGIVDATTPNPTHTFVNCGVYDVRLTVTDGVNPPHSLVRPAFVATDAVDPSFTSALVAPNGTVQFAHTSFPGATSWAWDFNGDTIVDSTLQNPQWTFGSACGAAHPVTLSVMRLCRGPFSVTQSVYAANRLETSRSGTTAVTGGFFLNLAVNNPLGVSVCQMDAKTTASPGANVTFEAFLTPTTYVGATGNPALWRQIGNATAIGVAGVDELEVATWNPPLYLPSGSYGLYLRVTGANPVGSSLTSAQMFGNADLSLQLGASGTLGSTTTANRGWNGALRYTTNASNLDAGFSFFGAGCAGPLGIPALTAVNLPRLGQTATVTINRLPQSAAFVLMGFNRQTSSLGPLPLDLTPFQMPGCSLHVANDAALFLLGSGNVATWNLGIPPQASMLGLQYYLQALALSPGTNGLGGVMSDAAVSVVGV